MRKTQKRKFTTEDLNELTQAVALTLRQNGVYLDFSNDPNESYRILREHLVSFLRESGYQVPRKLSINLWFPISIGVPQPSDNAAT